MQGLYGNIGEQIPDISMFPQMVNDISSLDSVESAKLRALRAKNVFTCQRALRTYVLTCQRGHVQMCQRACRDYVPTCQHASFEATIFSFASIGTEVVHTVGKV